MLSENEEKKNEHSILCPTNPYAATKAAAELIAASYRHSFNMPIIITRGNNVYGPNQHVEKLIPCFINKILNNEKMPIQGEGLAKRAFMFVSDTVSAFELILDNGVIGEIYNIGCDDGYEYTVKEVATTLLSIIREDVDVDSYIEYIIDRPYNDMRYYISNNKLKELGWIQKVDFISGITKLINHFKH